MISAQIPKNIINIGSTTNTNTITKGSTGANRSKIIGVKINQIGDVIKTAIKNNGLNGIKIPSTRTRKTSNNIANAPPNIKNKVPPNIKKMSTALGIRFHTNQVGHKNTDNGK